MVDFVYRYLREMDFGMDLVGVQLILRSYMANKLQEEAAVVDKACSLELSVTRLPSIPIRTCLPPGLQMLR
jgi:hypothetical protein